MLQELIQLQQTGTLTKMVRAGLVSSKVYTYLEIYMFVDARRKTRKCTKESIILEASEQFKVSRVTIFKALKAVNA